MKAIMDIKILKMSENPVKYVEKHISIASIIHKIDFYHCKCRRKSGIIVYN
jgi:hypothetical protein